MDTQLHTSTGKNDWGTPDYLFKPISEVIDFTFDACADSYNYLLPRYSTDICNETLNNETIWCNPPYSRDLQGIIAKFLLESNNRVIMLVPVRSATKLWQDLYFKHSIIFLRGQIKFKNAKHNSPFASALICKGFKKETLDILASKLKSTLYYKE